MRLTLSNAMSHPHAMLTEIYIEALLVDEDLADQIWAALMAGEIDDLMALMMWVRIVWQAAYN